MNVFPDISLFMRLFASSRYTSKQLLVDNSSNRFGKRYRESETEKPTRSLLSFEIEQFQNFITAQKLITLGNEKWDADP